MNYPRYIVFHTADAKGDHDIEDVRDWHTLPPPLGNGWDDVGYHYYIRRSGELQVGRLEQVPGAHAWGYNKKSIGVAFEGDHDDEVWTYEQLLTFLSLVKDLFIRYPILPERVIGHRETGSPKTCPGTLIDCDRVRDLIIQYLQ